jgi:hypothetical protein
MYRKFHTHTHTQTQTRARARTSVCIHAYRWLDLTQNVQTRLFGAAPKCSQYFEAAPNSSEHFHIKLIHKCLLVNTHKSKETSVILPCAFVCCRKANRISELRRKGLLGSCGFVQFKNQSYLDYAKGQFFFLSLNQSTQYGGFRKTCRF